jgi:hypothetical protein
LALIRNLDSQGPTAKILQKYWTRVGRPEWNSTTQDGVRERYVFVHW